MEEVPEFDPLNYKLLQADLAALPDCLEAPYDDMSIEKWNTDNKKPSECI